MFLHKDVLLGMEEEIRLFLNVLTFFDTGHKIVCIPTMISIHHDSCYAVKTKLEALFCTFIMISK